MPLLPVAPLPVMPLLPVLLPLWPLVEPLVPLEPVEPVDCPPAEPVPVPDWEPLPLVLPPLPVWPLVPPVCATAAALIRTAVIIAVNLAFMFAPRMDNRSGHFSQRRIVQSRSATRGGVGLEDSISASASGA
jgi:hypothetical protein